MADTVLLAELLEFLGEKLRTIVSNKSTSKTKDTDKTQ